MSIYEQFKTDPELEKNGIIIDYDTFRVTLARAGGANAKFNSLMEAKAKPFRRLIQAEMITREQVRAITREVFVACVILNWETKIGDVFVQGLEDPEDKTKTIPFNKENMLAMLTKLPDLFDDLEQQATKGALFREVLLEEDAKN